MVARTIRPGDARAVEHEGDARLVEGDVHEHLVEGAIHEGRVHRDDRMQPAEREPGRRRDRVLFGDSHVEHPLGEPLGELVQAGRTKHRGRDADDARILFGDLEDLVGEDRGPGWPAGDLDRLARLRVDVSDSVELVGDVVQRGLVAAALLGDGVDDHGRAVVLRLDQRVLHGVEVVAVDRPDVFDVEVRVERLVVGEARQEAVQAAANAAIERASRVRRGG